MNRRTFFSGLLSIPLIGTIVAKAAPLRATKAKKADQLAQFNANLAAYVKTKYPEYSLFGIDGQYVWEVLGASGGMTGTVIFYITQKHNNKEHFKCGIEADYTKPFSQTAMEIDKSARHFKSDVAKYLTTGTWT